MDENDIKLLGEIESLKSQIAELRMALAGMENAGIGVAYDFSVRFHDQIWIFFHGFMDSPGKFFCGGHIVFKGDGGVRHIGRVYFKEPSGVCFPGGANYNFTHGRSSFPVILSSMDITVNILRSKLTYYMQLSII